MQNIVRFLFTLVFGAIFYPVASTVYILTLFHRPCAVVKITDDVKKSTVKVTED